jgi:hypothetical protein
VLIKHASAFSRRHASEVWPNFCPSDNRGRRESRVLDAPAASRAKLSEAHERSHHRITGTPGLPCAMVLTVSFVLSPVIGLVCHRRLRIGGEFGPVGPALASANLTPASGRQDHTTSPSATCVVRLRAGRPLTSPIRTRPATPFARRRCRVHRIPPRVRDDREPPLWGRDGQAYRVDFSKRESGIFFESGLDRICRFARQAVCEPRLMAVFSNLSPSAISDCRLHRRQAVHCCRQPQLRTHR